MYTGTQVQPVICKHCICVVRVRWGTVISTECHIFLAICRWPIVQCQLNIVEYSLEPLNMLAFTGHCLSMPIQYRSFSSRQGDTLSFKYGCNVLSWARQDISLYPETSNHLEPGAMNMRYPSVLWSKKVHSLWYSWDLYNREVHCGVNCPCNNKHFQTYPEICLQYMQ